MAALKFPMCISPVGEGAKRSIKTLYLKIVSDYTQRILNCVVVVLFLSNMNGHYSRD
ncbi:hypothetical protein HpBGD53_03850 [Helicobacter pylori]